LLQGEAEDERLRVQAEVFAEETEALLDACGVGPGWRCADLAPGPVGILSALSRRVGATGRVLAVDLDPGPAAHTMATLGLGNGEAVRADAFATGLPAASLDFAHARAFLAVAGRADELLRELVRMVRPGGVIALVEPAGNPPLLHPPCPAHDRIYAAVAALFARSGGGMDVGLRLPGLLRRAGIRPPHVRAFTRAFPGGHPYARNTLAAAASLRAAIVAAGLMAAEGFDRDWEEASRRVADPDSLYVNFTMIEVWGRRPAGSP
jgi:SAM-dependent methyltransferase